MELIDTTQLKIILKKVEEDYRQNPNEINKARLGIIYHETALNLSFFSKTEFKGYAKKSFDTLSEMFDSSNTTKELMPFIASFRASALSLVGAETKKLKFIGEAFTLFNDAIEKYATISYFAGIFKGKCGGKSPLVFLFQKEKCEARLSINY